MTRVHQSPSAHAAKALLDALAATPRGAGTEGERKARDLCAQRFATAGFEVREVAFTYSTFPGRWATPIAGLGVLIVTSVAGHFGYLGRHAVSLSALGIGLLAIAAFALWSARRGALDAPLGRAAGVNLVAVPRGATSPDVWLVAHLDSKSQPISIGVRAAAIVLAALACVMLLALGLAAVVGAAWAGAGHASWKVATLLGWTAAVPITLTTVGNRSPGALDNASGVVSVILAAEAMPPDVRVGVLLTSAEELGLAGARAWARDVAPRTFTAINCDGVDDTGTLTVMRARGGDAVVRALAQAARDAGIPFRIRGLLPGVLVDAVALADAGWRAATVSRGTLRTLLRIHGRRDTRDRLDGGGMAEAAGVIGAAATALARASHATPSGNT